jgi:hypothetical protein
MELMREAAADNNQRSDLYMYDINTQLWVMCSGINSGTLLDFVSNFYGGCIILLLSIPGNGRLLFGVERVQMHIVREGESKASFDDISKTYLV